MTHAPPLRYYPIAVSAESTVVGEYVPDAVSQAYEYVAVTSEAQLVANPHARLEALNGVVFTEGEWERLASEKSGGCHDRRRSARLARRSPLGELKVCAIPPAGVCESTALPLRIHQSAPSRVSWLVARVSWLVAPMIARHEASQPFGDRIAAAPIDVMWTT